MELSSLMNGMVGVAGLKYAGQGMQIKVHCDNECFALFIVSWDKKKLGRLLGRHVTSLGFEEDSTMDNFSYIFVQRIILFDFDHGSGVVVLATFEFEEIKRCLRAGSGYLVISTT